MGAIEHLPNRGLVDLLADTSIRIAGGQPIGSVHALAGLDAIAELLGRLEGFRPVLVHAARSGGLDWPMIAEASATSIEQLQVEYSAWLGARRDGVAS